MRGNPASKLARRIADGVDAGHRRLRLDCVYPEHAPALCAVCTIAAIEREFGPICEVLEGIAEATEIDGEIDAGWKDAAHEALAKLESGATGAAKGK